MPSMNVSLPEPMRDYVQTRVDSGQYGSASDYIRDLIRQDQNRIIDDERWLRDLDAAIADTLTEMDAGGGVDLNDACEAIAAELGSLGSTSSR